MMTNESIALQTDYSI